MTEPSRRVRVTFLTEQHVGLKTYSENLRRFADSDERIIPTWVPITYLEQGGFWERLRFLPSGIRGAFRGRSQVRRAVAETRPDACLYMTQTPAALGGNRPRRTPYVIMLDDTPILFDSMAEHYEEPPDRFAALRWIKHKINVTALRGAHAVLPMSEWARRSLLDDYGVAPANARVVPTGIDLEQWQPGDATGDGPLRILFVGGDFERKGGAVLAEAFERLDPGSAELHVVTRSPITERRGVHVHTGLHPNDPELIELFRSCDVFVLPSKAEAYPNVVVEACAAGLPCIVSDVGGMSEMIVEGESGFVLQPGDTAGLAELLRRLAGDPELRVGMGRAARERAVEMFDGRKNARRVVDILLEAV
jgi:glycosyltransferase involved in cell wall biosynthesis